MIALPGNDPDSFYLFRSQGADLSGKKKGEIAFDQCKRGPQFV